MGNKAKKNSSACLVDVVLPGEEGGAVEQLPEYAAHRPQVHPLCVAPGSVQQFGGAVPAGRHLPHARN